MSASAAKKPRFIWMSKDRVDEIFAGINAEYPRCKALDKDKPPRLNLPTGIYIVHAHDNVPSDVQLAVYPNVECTWTKSNGTTSIDGLYMVHHFELKSIGAKCRLYVKPEVDWQLCEVKKFQAANIEPTANLGAVPNPPAFEDLFGDNDEDWFREDLLDGDDGEDRSREPLPFNADPPAPLHQMQCGNKDGDEVTTVKNLHVSGQLTVLSDETTKDNLTRHPPLDPHGPEAEEYLKKFNGINLYSFVNKHGLHQSQGFSAQNLQAQFPHLVTRLANGKLAIDYTAIIAELIRLVQYLLARGEASKANVLQLLSQPGMIQKANQLKSDNSGDDSLLEAIQNLSVNNRALHVVVNNTGIITPHPYQERAVLKIGSSNAVLVLGTNMGKTLISMLVCEANFKRIAGKKTFCMFVCENRMLAKQQCRSYAHHGPETWRLGCATGSDLFMQWNRSTNQGSLEPSRKPKLTPENWTAVLSESFDVVFATAGLICQLMECADDASLDLSWISLLVLDECHHSREGNHQFGKVVRTITELNPLCQVLGLTASPVTGTTDRAELAQDLILLQQLCGNAQLVRPDVDHPQKIVETPVELLNNEDDYVEKALLDLLLELRDLSCEYDYNVDRPSCLKEGKYGESVIKWAQEERACAKEQAAKWCFFIIEHAVHTLLLVETLGAVCANDLLPAIVVLSDACDQERDENVKEEMCAMLDLVYGVFQEEIASRIGGGFKCKRLEYLTNRLLNDNNKQRNTLVRVKTKLAVFWLARRLRELGVHAMGLIGDTPDSSAQLLVDEFNSPASSFSVLVATSLVEEGMDLKRCGLVVSYGVDGVLNSGKSLVQNRGRARDPQSEFVVLYKSKSDALRYHRVQNQVQATTAVTMAL